MPQPLTIPDQIELEQFISQEAHDLKSPYNRILGFLKLVLKGMDGPIPDLAKEDLTTAYVNAMHAMLMMSSLVEVSRLNRGERKLHLGEVQADQVAAQAASEWKKTAPRICELEVKELGAEALVSADEGLLRQCLLNWMLFLVEQAAEGAVLKIEGLLEEKRCVFTYAIAPGKELPPSELELSMYGYIARQILLLHGGELLAAEKDDQGVRVVFALPRPA
jgi:signal transduction histidine kinase